MNLITPIKRDLVLDFDSTIVDSIKAYCGAYNEIFRYREGFVLSNPDKVKEWNLGDQCPLAIDMVEQMFGGSTFFNYLELFPDADEIIKKLVERYNVSICTIGSQMNIRHKSKWISQNLPMIKNAIYIYNDHATMDKSKINMSGAIFVDDHAGNLLSSNAEDKYCFGKKFDWNKDWDSNWVKNWKDIGERFL